MSEFTAANPYYTSSSMNKNGTNHRAPPTNGNYKGKVMPVEDEDDDDEIERGHWGSKAEFILSCIGFSVSIDLFVWLTFII